MQYGIEEVERDIQRENTERFIAADAFQCFLYRRTATADGAGGYELSDTGAMQWPQAMRLVPSDSGTLATAEHEDATGTHVTPTHVLLGTHDANVERWDTFVHNGRSFQVLYVEENAQYQKKADVLYLGTVSAGEAWDGVG